jgi:hypothetical protein
MQNMFRGIRGVTGEVVEMEVAGDEHTRAEHEVVLVCRCQDIKQGQDGFSNHQHTVFTHTFSETRVMRHIVRDTCDETYSVRHV